MAKHAPWTKEDAAEAGRKGGLASAARRRRRMGMTEEERALDAISAKLGRLTDELLAAALGDGEFSSLKPETRLTAILRAMEWKLGKAPTAPRQETKAEETPPPSGDDLFES